MGVDEVSAQREYFARVAQNYDGRTAEEFEHFFALSVLLGTLEFFNIESVLDVGSGTGRALRFLKSRRPDLKFRGIEPVDALRRVGHENGLSPEELTSGDATQLPFKDGEFDLVTEFGVLHHIRKPEQAVGEMLRVARKAVFISDSNNFGQGSKTGRGLKQVLNALGLWRIADLIKTRGRGYTESEGDGIAYSYSVFNNYEQIASVCDSVHVINTSASASTVNPYRSATHVALLGLKR